MLRPQQKFWRGHGPPGTMPWNVLATPQKFKFRIREKWKFQPHNWVNKQSRVKENSKLYFWDINFGWYIWKKKKPFSWFFQKFHFLQYHFFQLCCRFAMAWHGKSLTMNFSCPGSKFWLDDRKVLGFCGVLYSETFKALCLAPPTNEATGTEQGQALPSSTKQGQALACSYVWSSF